ncbi:ran-binding protein 10 [Neocloeon triangulifer]|uniref:ran-binding protein 10 n=1 Tax=Neocloeon triangulifer TaxID=2078957 RepID=UPI00286F00A2|nr:ran-binding protein 10 [Neocloeon triangulifer]
MASLNNTGQASEPAIDRLKQLYPMVNEEETPLPRCWSPKDKYNYIGLSQNNLRVHYKGHGKTHKDAASVRATHSIPAACGLYYFEVKIVSKGRDGYMGIGLSAENVNMNRLPGWDKHSYGYHGDDGHSFCSSGTGQPYGPTFTTGDVVGCGINLIDGVCFYTKNGHNLGVAFTDLPPKLYPTVGLQTPGEVVDANFGQQPFVFDLEDEMKALRARTRATIQNYTIPGPPGQWTSTLQKVVCSYLVHHGYCSTAEAFAKSSGQQFNEEITSIRNRQRILRLVLAGKIGDAIADTQRLYPGLLESDAKLMFLLKCRQFIEMVSGVDVSDSQTPPRIGTPQQQSVIQSTKSYKKPRSNLAANFSSPVSDISGSEENSNSLNGETDVDMEANNHNNGCHQDGHEDMEVDTNNANQSKQGLLCGGSKTAVERMLSFGRELYALSIEVNRDPQSNQMLQDAFSLLAYSEPWKSPVGWQLDPQQREPVCAALNSAILQSKNLPRRPPLEIARAHAQELVSLMSRSGLGSCAFANLDELLSIP